MTKTEELEAAYKAACEAAETTWAAVAAYDAYTVALNAARAAADAYQAELKKIQEENSDD
jgi:aminoglycoside phosphotransferase (APT) family kinase protein